MQLGSNANCTKNICCRVFADSPPADQITDPALPFGNSHCDSPPSLAQTLLNAMTDKSLIGDVEFAIFTGDVVEGKSNSLMISCQLNAGCEGDTWLVNQTYLQHLSITYLVL